MKLTKILFIPIIIIFGISCKKNESNEKQTKNDSLSVGENILKVDTDSIIQTYLKVLNKSNTRIVDATECESSNGLKLYEKEIYTYSINDTKKLEFDYNSDEITDYLISYTANNCWQGIGAGNYLSNMFFITSENNNTSVNEKLTQDFKNNFLENIHKKYGNSGFILNEKEVFINGIEYLDINDNILSGKYQINTENCESAQPCFDGVFSYDLKNNSFSFDNQNNEKNNSKFIKVEKRWIALTMKNDKEVIYIPCDYQNTEIKISKSNLDITIGQDGWVEKIQSINEENGFVKIQTTVDDKTKKYYINFIDDNTIKINWEELDYDNKIIKYNFKMISENIKNKFKTIEEPPCLE